MSVVRPEYGPTIVELAGPRVRSLPRWLRYVATAVAAVVVVGLAAVAVSSSGSGLHDVLVSKPIAFTLGYRSGLKNVQPPTGELLRLQTPDGHQSFTARPVHFPAYIGDVTSSMLTLASQRMAELQKADPGVLYRGEGKARINGIPAYDLAFQTRRAGRILFGRLVFLAPVTDTNAKPTDGIELELLSGFSKAVPNVAAVGANGVLKAPLRSFRFGTSRP